MSSSPEANKLFNNELAALMRIGNIKYASEFLHASSGIEVLLCEIAKNRQLDTVRIVVFYVKQRCEYRFVRAVSNYIERNLTVILPTRLKLTEVVERMKEKAKEEDIAKELADM